MTVPGVPVVFQVTVVPFVCPYTVVEGTSGVVSPVHIRWMSNPAVVSLCMDQGGESARRRGWDTTRRKDSWDHCRY